MREWHEWHENRAFAFPPSRPATPVAPLASVVRRRSHRSCRSCGAGRSPAGGVEARAEGHDGGARPPEALKIGSIRPHFALKTGGFRRKPRLLAPIFRRKWQESYENRPIAFPPSRPAAPVVRLPGLRWRPPPAAGMILPTGPRRVERGPAQILPHGPLAGGSGGGAGCMHDREGAAPDRGRAEAGARRHGQGRRVRSGGRPHGVPDALGLGLLSSACRLESSRRTFPRGRGGAAPIRRPRGTTRRITAAAHRAPVSTAIRIKPRASTSRSAGRHHRRVGSQKVVARHRPQLPCFPGQYADNRENFSLIPELIEKL